MRLQRVRFLLPDLAFVWAHTSWAVLIDVAISRQCQIMKQLMQGIKPATF